MNILALSSSRTGNSGYLQTALPLIHKLLGDKQLHIAFVPFATVESQQDYYDKVSMALSSLPHKVSRVTRENGCELVSSCDAIMVGGGNTFKLLHDLYEADLVGLIREKVTGGMPYIGWSAGANILGPTIGTTNDMPIIQPQGFDALNIFPFQINPHYFNQPIEGFNGETRDQRLKEFLAINPSKKIIGLPEGTSLVANGKKIIFQGTDAGFLFYRKSDSSEIQKDAITEGWEYPG